MVNGQPKILVFTISAWNKYIGDNTMTSILEGYAPNNIANIFFRSETPTFEGCNNYFRICESDVIKSIYKKNVLVGKCVKTDEENAKALQEEKNRYGKFRSYRPWILLYLREVLWKMGKWKAESLKNFLDGFKPDIIFFSFEGYIFYNRVVNFAIDYTKAKAIGYFWDDTFTYKQKDWSFGFYIYRFFQRRSIKSLVKKTDSFFAISEKTKKEADKIFGINCEILTKPLNTMPIFESYKMEFPLKILYTGNLIYGRYKSLISFMDAVTEINHNGVKFLVAAYTSTSLSNVLREKLSSEYLKINDAIPQSEVIRLQKKADVLLFLEGMKGKDSKIARLSFSTKITDYLSSGKGIIAIGRKDTAPMEYFEGNKCAMTASSYSEIVATLSRIIEDKNIILRYAKKSVECAIKNHNKEEILSRFQSTVNSLTKTE